MYGPEATHSASYFAPESLAFGTGVVVGNAATYGNSGWAFGKANLMVLSSGVVTPGASPSEGPLYLRSGSSAFWAYCGPCSPNSLNDRAMPYAMSFEVIGVPSSNLMPSRRWYVQVLPPSVVSPVLVARSPTSLSLPRLGSSM